MEDINSESRSLMAEEDFQDLDRQIAEAEFLLAREEALNAARHIYHDALMNLVQPGNGLNSDSVSEAVAAAVCNDDQSSCAEEEPGAPDAPDVTSVDAHPSSTKAATPARCLREQPTLAGNRTYPVPSRPLPHRPVPGGCSWATFWYPLIFCFSIVTVPAEWAALSHSAADAAGPKLNRLTFQVVSQIVLSFLGACPHARLSPSHATMHLVLKSSVVCSWVLSALSYTRSLCPHPEQELALLLFFMRTSLSTGACKRLPALSLAVLVAVLARCALLLPRLAITLQPSHMLLACAAAACCRLVLHHLSTCVCAPPRPWHSAKLAYPHEASALHAGPHSFRAAPKRPLPRAGPRR